MAEGQLASYYEDPAILQQQQRATTAANQAGAYQSAAALLPTKLKEAIQEKLDYNKDLIEQKNKAMAEYFQTPSTAREKYAGIFNPMQREALVSTAKQQAWLPYTNMSEILSQRLGRESDMITAGTGAFNAATTAAQVQANNEQNVLESLMTMAKLKQAAFESTRNYNLDEYKATHPSGGSGSSLSDLAQIAAFFGINLPGDKPPLQKPPTPSLPYTSMQKEYPPGSGVFWLSDGQGGWK